LETDEGLDEGQFHPELSWCSGFFGYSNLYKLGYSRRRIAGVSFWHPQTSPNPPCSSTLLFTFANRPPILILPTLAVFTDVFFY